MTTYSSRLLRSSCIAGLVMIPALCSAAIVHRYDFATDANDSVGTSHGTLHGSATITGGGVYSGGDRISGTLNAGVVTNGVQLPASAVSGITGAFTVEAWIQTPFGGAFTTAFSFSDGTTSNYLLGTPARGNSPFASTISAIGAGGSATELQASGRYADTDQLIHMVLTYDGTTMTHYQNASTNLDDFNSTNSLSASFNNPGFNLSSLTQIGINGGAPWPDNSMNGTVFDFRIYDSSLGADQIASLFALGADATNSQIIAAIPEPAAAGLLALGAIGALRRRRTF
ncbi:MAG: LamG domain-containing protein [Verrucomicrobiaceae bacterium]|nr:MAG: LamG domain-containing protein [Verrucomicrobiaceae bacterium]